MTTRYLVSQRNRLDAAFARVSNLPVDQFEIRADFARYLCILVSGFLESVASDIAIDHCRGRSAPTVVRYVDSQLRRPGTLNSERLLQFVGAFSLDWRVALEEFIAGERKEALDSVVANRNNIAHGESVNLTFARISDYYRYICEVVDFLESMFAQQTS